MYVCAVFLLMGPSVTIPPDNTWHARGTAPGASYPLRLFGLQDVEDSRFRAYVLPDLWRNFVGGIVARLLLLPMWVCRGGIRGGRIVLRARPLFRVPIVVRVALRNRLWCQWCVGFFLCWLICLCLLRAFSCLFRVLCG